MRNLTIRVLNLCVIHNIFLVYPSNWWNQTTWGICWKMRFLSANGIYHQYWMFCKRHRNHSPSPDYYQSKLCWTLRQSHWSDEMYRCGLWTGKTPMFYAVRNHVKTMHPSEIYFVSDVRNWRRMFRWSAIVTSGIYFNNIIMILIF